MAKRTKKFRIPKTKRSPKPEPRGRKQRSIPRKRRLGISDVRLESAFRVFSRTKDFKAAARSIRVSEKRFRKAALKRLANRKKRRTLAIVRRLPRRMPIFTEGRLLGIAVRVRAASLIGRHMAAVGQFLKTNDPKYLAEFKGRSVKDVKGSIFQFETDPNVLYRLSSAGNEPFEEIYRIVI